MTYEDFIRNAKKKKYYIPTPKEYRFYQDKVCQFAFETKHKSKFVIKKGSSIVLNNDEIKSKKRKKSMGVLTEKDETFNAECIEGISICRCCPSLIAHLRSEVLPNINITTNPSNIEIVENN